VLKSSKTPTRRGRPRSPETRERILRAARQALGEVGYDRLTIGEVATRSGAGRSTIYRWWAGKGDLVLEAVQEHIAIGLVPDRGSTREDLTVAVGQLVRTFSDRLAAIVIFAAISTLDHDPTMATAFRDRFVYPWRSSAARALHRGVDRGDLPVGTDVAFVLDVIVGTVFQRTLVLREPDTRGLVDKLVDLVLRDPRS